MEVSSGKSLVILLLVSASVFAFGVRLGESLPAEIIVPDQYSTIQEAIDHADDGDRILVKAGTYYEHVIVNKTVALVGENVSTVIIDGNNTGHVIHVTRNNVNITGFTVQNSGSTHWPALEAGICLNHSAGCVVSGNRLINNGFSGISLLYSQRSIIIDNYVTGSSWGGIHLLTSSYNTVSGNILDSNTDVGINGHASSHYNNITENIISNSTYGMFYHDADYNRICKNNISSIAAEGIWLQDQVDHNTVAENSLINNKVAIWLQGPNSYNVLSGNLITGAEFGIKILNAQYTRIEGNVIVNNRAGNDSWRAGIRLESGRDSRIHSNAISGNYYGILLYSYSPRVSVYGNNITGNEFGFRVASGGSNNLNMSENLVANNVGYGVGLTGFGSSSNYATISRNTITNNSGGIALGQYSNYNTIAQNNITMNDCGFYIEYSTQNLIHGNNIVNNSQQAYVAAGSVNTWDDGHSAGGNYWSDYGGVDMFMGPYQNISGSDGIGDTSYNVDSGNRDRYPLMNPYPSVHALVADSVSIEKTLIGEGTSTTIEIRAIVTNAGHFPETCDVTICANATTLTAYANIVLAAGRSVTLSYPWNITGIGRDRHVITVAITPVQGENNIIDNTIASMPPLRIVRPGDGDADGCIGILDLARVTGAYGSGEEQSGFRPNADWSCDGVIDMLDVTVVTGQYGQKDP